MRHLLCLLLITLLGLPASGQDRVLVDAWLTTQEGVLAKVDSVVVLETFTLSSESPFGERGRSGERLKRLWPPPSPDREARPRPRPPRNRPDLRERRLPFAHIDAMLLLHGPRLQLEETLPSLWDGQRVIRHTLHATERRSPIRTAVLWIDPSTQRLVRSVVDLQLPFQDEPMRVETTYQHLDGLDLPATRSAEGHMRRKRRGRTFSHYLSFEARYTDIVLRPRL